MPELESLFKYLSYYGARGFAAKCREKLVDDRRRYAPAASAPASPPPRRGVPAPLPEPPLKKMNILLLTHVFYPRSGGGTERFVLNLARELISLGHRVRVLTGCSGRLEGGTPLGKNLLWQEYVFEDVPVTAFSYIRAPAGAMYSRVCENDPELEALFLKVAEEFAPDAVHAAYPQPFAAPLRLCRERGIKYVVTATDLALCCAYVNMRDRGGGFCPGSGGGKRCEKTCPCYGAGDFIKRHEAAARLLSGADHVTAPSEFLAAVLEGEFPSLSVRPEAHGISSAFCPSPARRGVSRFVYAGNLSALKGVMPLAEAFSGLKGEAELDIYGWGSSAAVRRLKNFPDDRVRFMGRAAAWEMPAVYQNADCVVVPSQYQESYNFVAREALQCGALAVVSSLGAIPEAVTPGENGFVFNPWEEGSLAAALEQARSFEWPRYKQAVFRTVRAEAEEYVRMYV